MRNLNSYLHLARANPALLGGHSWLALWRAGERAAPSFGGRVLGKDEVENRLGPRADVSRAGSTGERGGARRRRLA
jgi:hypothetical protein